jgi:hypothetical protein
MYFPFVLLIFFVILVVFENIHNFASNLLINKLIWANIHKISEKNKFIAIFIIKIKKVNTYYNMKRRVRLTEGDLHRIVKESVNRMLTELDWKTYQNAAKKAHLRALDDYSGQAGRGKYDAEKYNGYLKRASNFRKAAEDAFNREHGYDDGRFHLGLDSNMHGSSNGHYRYTDDSSINTHDRNDILDWGGERPYDLDYSFDRGWVPQEVNNRYDAAKQELADYKRGKYSYQKGKGWQNESVNRKIDRIVNESVNRILSEMHMNYPYNREKSDDEKAEDEEVEKRYQTFLKYHPKYDGEDPKWMIRQQIRKEKKGNGWTGK